MITSINEWKKINESINHNRVIPRDFFNESKLLKCMGQLAIKIHDGQLPEGISIEIEESGEPFDIVMSENGYIYVSNYPVLVNGNEATFGTTYNSKSAFPMVCNIGYDEFDVFDDNGNFDNEFIEYFTNVQSEEQS